MGFEMEAGYTLPSGDLPLTHGRVLHKGNRFRIKSIAASAEVSGFAGAAVDNALTDERWKPFANQAESPRNLGASDWTATNLTVGADNQTLTETAATGQHDVSQSFTFTAVEHVVAFYVQRQTMPEVQVRANDGTSSFTCFFDLRDGTVGTASGCVGQIADLGEDNFLLSIYFTPLAAAGVIELLGSNGSEAVSYTGDTSNTIKATLAVVHESLATLRLDGFTAQEGDLFAIAGHNLGSAAGRVTFQHDSNADDTFTDIGSVSPSDDGAIMFLFEPITSGRWRVAVDRAVLPEVAVIRIGAALQMLRPIHQGVAPFETNRVTSIRGNVSEGGEWIGRSVIRNFLEGNLEFPRLTPEWVRANIDGRGGMLQSLEVEPFFYAWRPATYAEAHYCWTTGRVQGPTFSQKPNLMTWAFSCQAYGFE